MSLLDKVFVHTTRENEKKREILCQWVGVSGRDEDKKTSWKLVQIYYFRRLKPDGEKFKKKNIEKIEIIDIVTYILLT